MQRTQSRPQGRKHGRAPVEARSSTEGKRRSLPRGPLFGVGGLVLLGLWTAASTESGRKASAYAFVVLDFFAGVIVLVTLSLAVMAGVFATDRTILQIRHRVMLQAFHRAMSVIAVSFLGVHIAVKVLGGRAGLLDAVIPFASREFTIFVGFGTIASYLLLVAFWTGVVRARFAGKSRPWLWRALHSCAYLSWPVALVHGLNAGRPSATWVVVSYVLCIGAVVIALLVRLYVTFGRRPSGVRTGPPTIGMNTHTVTIPRVREPIASTVGASAPPRNGAYPDQAAYAHQGEARPGRSGEPQWSPHQDIGPGRWEGPPPAGHWDAVAPPDAGWDGRPAQRWDGPPPPAGQWDERPAVGPDPHGQWPERPRRWLRLVDDIAEEPPSGASHMTAPHGWAGGPERPDWDQRSRDHHVAPGYQRPGRYPPSGGQPDRWGPRDLADRTERRRRGRRVS